MSTFPDGLYHYGGVPVASAGPIMKFADFNVYFVDGADGNDSNNGLKPDFAFKTIQKALDTTQARIKVPMGSYVGGEPWARNDVIYIAPGIYAENLVGYTPTGSSYAGVRGIKIIGCGYHDLRDGKAGVVIKPATLKPWYTEAVVNCELYNLGFYATTGDYAFQGGIVNNTLFHNCFFTGPAEDEDTIDYVFYTTDTVKTTWRDCWFANGIYTMYFANTTPHGTYSKIAYADINNCLFTNFKTNGIHTDSGIVGPHSVIRNSMIVKAGGTGTYGIDDDAGIFDVFMCAVEAGTAISGTPRSVNGSWGNGTLLT
jgi:hypothetical protein